MSASMLFGPSRAFTPVFSGSEKPCALLIGSGVFGLNQYLNELPLIFRHVALVRVIAARVKRKQEWSHLSFPAPIRRIPE